MRPPFGVLHGRIAGARKQPVRADEPRSVVTADRFQDDRGVLVGSLLPHEVTGVDEPDRLSGRR
jgi:hypothetical protein